MSGIIFNTCCVCVPSSEPVFVIPGCLLSMAPGIIASTKFKAGVEMEEEGGAFVLCGGDKLLDPVLISSSLFLSRNISFSSPGKFSALSPVGSTSEHMLSIIASSCIVLSFSFLSLCLFLSSSAAFSLSIFAILSLSSIRFCTIQSSS